MSDASDLTAAPKRPIREAALQWHVDYAGTPREIRSKALCDVGGPAKVGVGLLELPPGSDTTPAHYHSLEEEHLYVLGGRLVLHLGEHEYVMEPGSYVCFPAGQRLPHHLRNPYREPAQYLMVGERISADRVFHR